MPLPEEKINILRELGEEVQARREELGISYNDVYQRTRIRQPYLEAIESANYEVLPDAVYTLGFIRTYLEVLNFDDIYPEFRHWLLKNTRTHGKDTGEISPYDLPTPGFKLASRFWIFVVLLLIVVGAVTYVVYSWSKNGIPNIVIRNEPGFENNNQFLAVSGDEVSGDENNNGISGDMGVNVPPPVEPKPEPKKPELKLIAVSDDCWIRIRVGNGTITERTLRKGEEFTMELTERTRVNYGRPWVVTVLHNGKDIGSPYKSGARRQQVNFYDPDGRSGRIEANPQH